MKYKLLLISLVVITALQSCQKQISGEISADNTIPTPSLTGDSNYLWKIHEITVNGTSTDTIGVITYNYDALKRVISMIESSKDIDENPQESFYYFYNGADTVPYKSILYEESSWSIPPITVDKDTTIVYHFYDFMGRNIEDSIIFSSNVGSASSNAVNKYSYGPNKIYGFSYSVPIGTSGSYSPNRKDTASLDANGNIINNKSYSYNEWANTWTLNVISSFTYDDKPNPFSILSNFKALGVFPNGETFYNQCPQKNNRLTQREYTTSSSGGGAYYNYDYTNIYKANGLVKEMSVSSQPPSFPDGGKFIFVYKKL